MWLVNNDTFDINIILQMLTGARFVKLNYVYIEVFVERYDYTLSSPVSLLHVLERYIPSTS